MGAFTNQFEGISRDRYEELLAAAEGDANAEKFVRVSSSDENGRYHDPETQIFWDAEAHRVADQIDAWNTIASLLTDFLGVVVAEIPAAEVNSISLLVNERVALSLDREAILRASLARPIVDDPPF